MKVVHSNKKIESHTDLLSQAILHEREGEFPAAAKVYHKYLQAHPRDASIYDKLMRMHRDLKEYEKELAVINKAIRVFEKRQKELKPVYNKTIATLSKILLKATGLADEKGNNLYQPVELKRWKKRRETVMKRLGLSSQKSLL